MMNPAIVFECCSGNRSVDTKQSFCEEKKIVAFFLNFVKFAKTTCLSVSHETPGKDGKDTKSTCSTSSFENQITGCYNFYNDWIMLFSQNQIEYSPGLFFQETHIS